MNFQSNLAVFNVDLFGRNKRSKLACLFQQFVLLRGR